MTLPTRRQGGAFFCSALIGSLGGLIGLGGAEFRLPLLVGVFSLPTLEAVILNKAISLVVVASAMLFRSHAIELTTLYALSGVILNLLAGSPGFLAGCRDTHRRVGAQAHPPAFSSDHGP